MNKITTKTTTHFRRKKKYCAREFMFVCMYTINEIEEDNKEYQAHNRIKRKHVYTHIYRQAAKIKTHTLHTNK